MLEYTLPGVWRIDGAHSNLRLSFYNNKTWTLGGARSPEMRGTWNVTAQGLDLHVTRIGSAFGRGLAIAATGLVVSLSFGTAALIVPAAIAGIAASNAARGKNPGALGVFFRSDVRHGTAVAHYRLMSELPDTVTLQNTYSDGGYSNIVMLTLRRES